ncbi:MAG: prepilin peptidase, partial [Salinisphaera sp.]|nr:prepilin peptidase [Salinisphaera sp.]
MIQILTANPALWLGMALVLGLVVGSFLNVVIHRLPAMLDYAWRADAARILEQPEPAGPPPSLAAPASACPACGVPIKPW